MSTPVRLATRRSPLAMAQSAQIAERLAELTGRRVELVEVVTRGDVDPAPLAQIGGTGVFVAAVRAAVASGSADLAVHSLKDLPTAPDPGLLLAAVPARQDPRDALVSGDGSSLADLPAGARVGTGSPRRRAQLIAARPDLSVVEVRGNIDTRLARVLGGGVRPPDLGAVVLASAGLARLGRSGVVTELLEPDVMVPAPGQGALAVEIRSERSTDPALLTALRSLDDPGTRAAVTAERTVLAVLGAGCSAPVGAIATCSEHDPETLNLRTVLARPDGSLVRMSASGPIDRAEELGRSIAVELLGQVDPALRGSRT